MCLSVAGSRFTALRVALTGRVPGAQWTRLHSVDETIFMCGIYEYRACRVLFAEQLQDRGAHRARYVTVYKIFENVVITLFDFEQGTDENYYDRITSYFYSTWIPYIEPRSCTGKLYPCPSCGLRLDENALHAHYPLYHGAQRAVCGTTCPLCGVVHKDRP